MLDATESQKKKALRQEFLAKRKSFVHAHHSNLSQLHQDVAEQLNFLTPSHSGLAAAYSALPDELDPDPFVSQKSNWQFAFPKVEGSELSFWVPDSAEAFTSGAFGIREPDTARSRQVNIGDCDVVLVPGVVFDQKGGRIGYGRGFYDRALRGSKVLKIGIGYSVQLAVQDLPLEKEDVRMDWVVTENFSLQTDRTAPAQD
ncbi:MAG: 5-formyltetrahydrofolate cyclo-ligase [Bdellovibrionaceae bacterium]|nr:5-formyltetrahydrofolate cyclo-ligase [Bdellovibrionales bacterium]MCB9084370.1 5-formyltetrahydrofolate cyclo-ligase [Pseudobdellovibrionaceae bacterium]